MKVILINGSPHEKGCTYTALCEVEKALNAQGIETEIFWIGNKPITGCIGCGACRKLGRGFSVDTVNEFVEKAQSADGFIFGSPVHYAAASGAITSFMDRAFYSGGRFLQGKPAANIVSCRRGGAHGSTPEQVLQDEEGLQTMRTLGNNMAWLLKCIESGKAAGIEFPEREEPIRTNFIR